MHHHSEAGRPVCPFVDHEQSKELGQIHEVLIAHPEWTRWVHRGLTRAQGVSARKGRAGMSASMVLRVGLLKHRLDMSLRRLAPLLADSLSLREFVGLRWDPTPKRSTLQENLAKIRPETWGKILRGTIVSAEAQAFEDCSEARIDCTVVATNIHEPSDSSLLWDCVRVLSRCTWRGWRRLQAYVWSAVVAANLTKLARLRLGVT